MVRLVRLFDELRLGEGGKENKMQRFGFLVLALWLMFAAGCQTGGFGGSSKYEALEPTPLDYMQFVYQPAAHGDTISKFPVKLELYGSGYMKMVTGRSSRVTDSFWKKTDDPHWHDLRSRQTTIPKEKVTGYFRAFVQHGFFKNQDEPETPDGSKLIMLMRIGREKEARVTARQEYLDLFKSLLNEF